MNASMKYITLLIWTCF